ncbi:hypothetical protein FAIPA1_90011 [Frankia sp. AiPs1]
MVMWLCWPPCVHLLVWRVCWCGGVAGVSWEDIDARKRVSGQASMPLMGRCQLGARKATANPWYTDKTNGCA